MILPEHILYIIMIGLLIAATITDLKEKLIYDRFIAIGMVAAIIIRSFYRIEPWWNYLLTGLSVFIILLFIAAITQERSIGGGDVKLFAMLGLAFGWEPFILIFLLSHVLAAIYIGSLKLIRWREVDRHSEFPFAPFILVGTILTYSYLFFVY